MKAYYMAVVNPKRDIGVYKKICAQIKSMNQAGIETKLIRIKQNVQQLSKEYYNVTYNWKDIRIPKEIDALYIRYTKASYGLLRFLRKFKRERAGRKVLIEIPTYPYEGEEDKHSLPVIIQDRIFRKFLKYYVDRMVTYSKDKYVFGIKNIVMPNGVDIDEITKKNTLGNDTNDIHMIAVATMKFWHGYDRLLEGLGNYYQKSGSRKVYLHLVGSGPELAGYQKIVHKYKIEPYVVFHGNKEGKNLDDIYDRCDIGVLALGTHRKGSVRPSELKGKEYMAKGIASIGCIIDELKLEGEFQCAFELEEGEKPININQVIQFYDQLYEGNDKDEIVDKIRNIAKEKHDIRKVFYSVIKYLKG